MLFKEIKIGEKEYKLRLSTRSTVEIERRLGKSPIDLLIEMSAGEGEVQRMPKLESLLVIFHASLQKYHHGIAFDDCYDIYDEYVDNGGTLMSFMPIIMDIFKVSGFFKEEEQEEIINIEEGK